MIKHDKRHNAEVVNIISRNSEIAYRLYKQRFYDTMAEYHAWRGKNNKDLPSVMEWRVLLEGIELRQKAEMWLGICLRLKEHVYQQRRNNC